MDPSMKPRGRADVFYQEVAEGCVLFDSKAEKVYVLNPTAAYVWNSCTGTRALDDLVSELETALGAKAPGRAQLRKDVEQAVDQFRGQGLLDGGAAS